MPHIEITMLTGRTTEQKRRLVQRITDAMMEEAGCTRDVVSMSFVEVAQDSFARGGLLYVDSKAAKAERS
jgi:4-oxalocrotonate tautomerase